jgi:hypothetical protein
MELKPAAWTLKISSAPPLLFVELEFKPSPNSEQKIKLLELKLDATADIVELLEDEEFRELLSLNVLDAMPFVGYLSRRQWRPRGEFEVKIPVRSPQIEWPYQKMILYSLEFETKTNLWKTKVLGTGIFGDGKLVIVALAWNVSPKGAIFVHGDNGPGHFAAENLEALGRYLKEHPGEGKQTDTESIVERIPGGFGGIRYGYPLMRQNSILSRAALINAFVEVRSGFFQGFRLGVDYVPKVSVAQDEQKNWYGWNRTYLGWSLGYDLNNMLFSRIDATPKLGLLNFDANIRPSEALEGQTVLPERIKLKNAPNLGIEIGIERVSFGFLFRIWGASDITSIVKVSDSATVRSLRAGIDSYLSVWEFGKNSTLSLVLFMAGEQLSIITKDQDEITSNQGFAGGGVTLGW